MSEQKIETKCLHAGYTPKNSEPRVLPIVQSTTYVYDSTADVAAVFDDPTKSLIYSRFANPTVMAVEDKIAALEGGIGAMCTTSGQAATLLAILNICEAGDSLISTPEIYGGTINLFSFTLKRFGIECIYVSQDWTDEEIEAAIKSNTKLFFGETIANPALTVFDIERFANIAHRHNLPLIIDNTFATPILCRPIEFGADIVIHSTSKYMDGHAVQNGGVIVDSGKFDWVASGKFPQLTEPDPCYHGVRFVDAAGPAAYAIRIRAVLLRDTGATISPFNAFILLQGLETLSLRVERHVENALKVVEFLKKHPKVVAVNHPSLPEHPDHALYGKYFPNGGGSIFTFEVRGGVKEAQTFIDSLQIFSLLANVADVKSLVIHPATTTHSQLSARELEEQGIKPGTVRLSIGTEHIDDLLDDLSQAFDRI